MPQVCTDSETRKLTAYSVQKNLLAQELQGLLSAGWRPAFLAALCCCANRCLTIWSQDRLGGVPQHKWRAHQLCSSHQLPGLYPLVKTRERLGAPPSARLSREMTWRRFERTIRGPRKSCA